MTRKGRDESRAFFFAGSAPLVPSEAGGLGRLTAGAPLECGLPWALQVRSCPLGPTFDERPCVYYTHRMKSADLIRALVAEGWFLDRVRGSHHVFRHPSRAGIVVVPHPKKDLGKGLVAKIRKQAGI